MYDVVIVGGSFAGLAAAMQLSGHRVLVIDQHPIGAHQSSTCCVPLRLVEMVGARDTIYEVHDTIALHLAGREIRYSLPESYATFHYRAFCQAMLAQCDVEVWQARATGYAGGEVSTNRGPVPARFVVDATGWREFSRKRSDQNGSPDIASRGIETELPLRADVNPGMHFFYERRLVSQGYAWIFPCGERTRIGIASAADRPHLRSRLNAFLGELGLDPGTTHGGVMPVTPRDPVAGEVFLVGDAAGQCLPVSLEGIRSAITSGFACGEIIRAALDGKHSAQEARRRYREFVQRTARFHHNLLTMHSLVERIPESLLMLGARACTPEPVAHLVLNTYLRSSGWSPQG